MLIKRQLKCWREKLMKRKSVRAKWKVVEEKEFSEIKLSLTLWITLWIPPDDVGWLTKNNVVSTISSHQSGCIRSVGGKRENMKTSFFSNRYWFFLCERKIVNHSRGTLKSNLHSSLTLMTSLLIKSMSSTLSIDWFGTQLLGEWKSRGRCAFPFIDFYFSIPNSRARKRKKKWREMREHKAEGKNSNVWRHKVALENLQSLACSHWSPYRIVLGFLSHLTA